MNKRSYHVEIVEHDISWEEAAKKEIELILYYGRRDLKTGTLVNMTAGGIGGATTTGRKNPSLSRLNLSRKGIPLQTKAVSWINKNGKNKRIDIQQIDEYLIDGWEVGIHTNQKGKGIGRIPWNKGKSGYSNNKESIAKFKKFKIMRIYIDLDGVLCDFMKAARKHSYMQYPQSRVGIFRDMEPIEGAIEAFKELFAKYDVWILTRASAKNINSYSEKAEWVLNNLGYEAQLKLILSHDKSLLIGDVLIDDDTNANQEKFLGEVIKFGSGKYLTWKDVVERIEIKAKRESFMTR